MDMATPYVNQGRGVTADNFFSSKKLAEELLQKKTTYLGTMRKKRREIPFMMKQTQGRQIGSSRYLYTEDLTLLSYLQKKSKNVMLISTQHNEPADGVDRHGKVKPQMILDYNKTKGKVD